MILQVLIACVGKLRIAHLIPLARVYSYTTWQSTLGKPSLV